MNSQQLTHIRSLAVAARDAPATWGGRDCPMVALINAIPPSVIVELIDGYTDMRSRLCVSGPDVEAAGVTRAHVEAWLRSKGWEPSPGETGWKLFRGGTSTNTQTWRSNPRGRAGVSIQEVHSPDAIADNILSIAYHFDRSDSFDVLDEIKAMKVEGQS